MINSEFISIVTQLFFGFLAAFSAALCWSKTRESSWLYIISGTLVHYLSVLHRALMDMEVLSPSTGSLGGIPLLSIFLSSVPYILYSIGFFLLLWKKRRY